MFFNAIMYNSSDHAVYALTLAMWRDTERIIREYLNTQVRYTLNYLLRTSIMIIDLLLLPPFYLPPLPCLLVFLEKKVPC
jgi:hypothetical protein